jgi:hypothetical protein
MSTKQSRFRSLQWLRWSQIPRREHWIFIDLEEFSPHLHTPFTINFNIIISSMSKSQKWFLHVRLCSLATCSVLLILFALVALTVFGKEYGHEWPYFKACGQVSHPYKTTRYVNAYFNLLAYLRI